MVSDSENSGSAEIDQSAGSREYAPSESAESGQEERSDAGSQSDGSGGDIELFIDVLMAGRVR